MKLFRGFAIASAVLALVIAVLGSWVRISDAGLTCPDWPLCRGHLVPTLTGGVVLEWSHRLVAFVEAFAVLGAIVTGWRVRKNIAGVTGALAALGVIFLVQVLLGGATVLLGNSPLSVMVHWAMGMAVLATLTSLAVLSIAAPVVGTAALRPRLRESVAPALAIAAAFAFGTMCIGAYVSSSYAGLACPSVPLCGATVLGTTAGAFVQMFHRLFAAAFFLVALIAVVVSIQNGSGRVRAAASTGFGLVIVQIALGIGNVVFRLPTEMREAHAANAAVTFLAFVIAAVLATLEPKRVAVPVREPALATRIVSNA